MGLFSKKEKVIKTIGKLECGIDDAPKGRLFNIILKEDENKVLFECGKNFPQINLMIDKITGATVISEKEIVEKGKSVTGRAIAGGVLLGPLGILVGGMSGIGNKSKTETKYYIVFNYNSNDGVKILSFETMKNDLSYWKFIDKLNHLLKKEENIYL